MTDLSRTIKKLSPDEFPPLLHESPKPPETLYLCGTIPNPQEYYYLAVVGSRKYTPYGREAIERIISGLKGYPFCIVSGLALGIDGAAHRAALDAGLPTLAVPGSGLSEKVLYPSSHRALAREIIEHGGGLLSEYEPDLPAAPWTFPARNRIMAGLCQAVLVIEAEEQSGTLITARLALDYNRTVLAVPGSIFSATSKGTNKLIRQGATPITSAEDLLLELGFIDPSQLTKTQKPLDLALFTSEEQQILLYLTEPRTREDILASVSLSGATTLSTLTVLEIKGVIRESLGKFERI